MTSTINLFTQSFNRFANLSLNKSNSHRIQLFQVNVSNVADTICGVLQTRIIGPLLLADTICGVLQTRIIGPFHLHILLEFHILSLSSCACLRRNKAKVRDRCYLFVVLHILYLPKVRDQ
jgi:hypothetical protein